MGWIEMFQYLINTLTEKIKNEKVNLEEKEQEKENIENKLSLIETYNDLKEKIKIFRVRTGLGGGSMLLLGGLSLTLEMPVGMYLALYFVIMGGCLVFEKIHQLRDFKKAIRMNFFEGINKLIENQESMEERSQSLKEDIENRKRVIHGYEEELKRVLIMDEFERNQLYNQLLYQADTKEEYELLRRKQEQEMMPFEEFLNESVDYGNVHLEVSEVDRSQKVFVKKK